MTINITKEIEAAYKAFLAEQVDAYVDGAPILRSQTYPFSLGHSSVVEFAAGWQAALSAGQATETLRAALSTPSPLPAPVEPTALPTQGDLNSPITTLCADCREAQWCIPSKQCLLARLKKSEAWHDAALNLKRPA